MKLGRWQLIRKLVSPFILTWSDTCPACCLAFFATFSRNTVFVFSMFIANKISPRNSMPSKRILSYVLLSLLVSLHFFFFCQSGMIPTRDEFYTSVIDIKENLLNNGLSKISADNLEKLFHYFEVEYPKISDEGLRSGTNDRVNSSSLNNEREHTHIGSSFSFRNEHDDNNITDSRLASFSFF